MSRLIRKHVEGLQGLHMSGEGELSPFLSHQAEGDISDHLPKPLCQRRNRAWKREAARPVSHGEFRARLWHSCGPLL